jgi:hypothetical protein
MGKEERKMRRRKRRRRKRRRRRRKRSRRNPRRAIGLLPLHEGLVLSLDDRVLHCAVEVISKDVHAPWC